MNFKDQSKLKAITFSYDDRIIMLSWKNFLSLSAIRMIFFTEPIHRYCYNMPKGGVIIG